MVHLIKPCGLKTVVSLLQHCFEWLGILASDDLGRREILKFNQDRWLLLIKKISENIIPLLGYMDMRKEQDSLTEQTAWFFMSASAGISKLLVDQVGALKIYPGFILQQLLLSDDCRYFRTGMQILSNLARVNPKAVGEFLLQSEESIESGGSTFANKNEFKSGLQKMHEFLEDGLADGDNQSTEFVNTLNHILDFYRYILRSTDESLLTDLIVKRSIHNEICWTI
jgi:hypothetical protein